MSKMLEKQGFTKGGEKTPKFFEEWAKRNMMKPVCKVTDEDGEILLADSHEPIRKGKVWSPESDFYRTGYAIHRSGLEIGNYNDYPASDYAFMSRQKGIEQRVNEALEHARQTQKQLVEAGYYDADRKGRFNIH